MHRSSLDFLTAMFPFENLDALQILIVNQTDGNPLVSSYAKTRVINSTEKGLSKSRNLALTNAQGKLCVLTDDDVVFEKDFIETILKGFSVHPQAAAIKFCVTGLNGSYFKKYPTRAKKQLSHLDILSTMSIELAYNREVIETTDIEFDTRFGLGSEYPLGEEQVFLKDLKEEGYTVSYYPGVLVSHPEIKNSDAISFLVYWETMGALYNRMFQKMKYFWMMVLIFFKVKSQYLSFTKMGDAIKHFKKGAKEFQNQHMKN